jgi:hypothetical protein
MCLQAHAEHGAKAASTLNFSPEAATEGTEGATSVAGRWMTVSSKPGMSSSVVIHDHPVAHDLELIRISLIKGSTMRAFIASCPEVKLDVPVCKLESQNAVHVLKLFNQRFEERALQAMAESMGVGGATETRNDGPGADTPTNGSLSGSKRKITKISSASSVVPKQPLRTLSDGFAWIRRTIGPQAGSAIRVGSTAAPRDRSSGRTFPLGANGLMLVVLRSSAAVFAPERSSEATGFGKGEGGWENDYFEALNPERDSVQARDKIILEAAVVHVSRGHRLKDGTEMRKPGSVSAFREDTLSIGSSEHASKRSRGPITIAAAKDDARDEAKDPNSFEAMLQACGEMGTDPHLHAPCTSSLCLNCTAPFSTDSSSMAYQFTPTSSLANPAMQMPEAFWMLIQPSRISQRPDGVFIPMHTFLTSQKLPYFPPATHSLQSFTPMPSFDSVLPSHHNLFAPYLP